MQAPHDIWLDANLHVTTNEAARYMLARRKGDRLSRIDAERFGVKYVEFDMNGHSDEKIVQTAMRDASTVRTAAVDGPRVNVSPRKRKARR